MHKISTSFKLLHKDLVYTINKSKQINHCFNILKEKLFQDYMLTIISSDNAKVYPLLYPLHLRIVCSNCSNCVLASIIFFLIF